MKTGRAFFPVIVTLVLLGSSGYAQEVIFGPKTYIRTAGAPNRFTETFTTLPGEARLVLKTKDEETGASIGAAGIDLNGIPVFGPQDFNPTVSALEKQVSLLEENTLQIELLGKPGSRLVVEIIRVFVEEIPAWRMPELAVTGLVVSPLLADPDDTVEIAVTVRNTARGETPEATLSVSLNGGRLRGRAVPSLGPAEMVEFRCTWTADSPGRHLVRAELEIPDGGFDGNLANNIAVGTVRVSGVSDPTPEIELVDTEISTLAFNADES